jgi:hypothetical protein
MSRYKELVTIGPEWQPFECFSDANGLLGVAMAPWLRGGARYLMSILKPLDVQLVAPEHMPIEAWFMDVQKMADCLAEFTHCQASADYLDEVRSRWDSHYPKLSATRASELQNYYSQVQIASEHLGLESNPQRIAEMRRKMTIASHSRLL